MADNDVIEDVRGPGIMIACDLRSADETKAVVQHCLNEAKLILMTAGAKGNTIRFMPPLTVTEAEIDLALNALSNAITSASA